MMHNRKQREITVEHSKGNSILVAKKDRESLSEESISGWLKPRIHKEQTTAKKNQLRQQQPKNKLKLAAVVVSSRLKKQLVSKRMLKNPQRKSKIQQK